MPRKHKRFRHRRRQERWALNCEHVFSVLTSGPFPTGDAEDDLIDAHLSFCPDCRRLAEALRPTESMLSGATPRGNAEPQAPSTSEALPAYWTAERRLSALDELEFPPRQNPWLPNWPTGDLWALALGVVGIAAIVGVFYFMTRSL